MQIQDQELADLFGEIPFSEDQDALRLALNDLIATIANPNPAAADTTESANLADDESQQELHLHVALKDLLTHLRNVQARGGTLYSCEQMVSALYRCAKSRLEDVSWKQLTIHILALIITQLARHEEYSDSTYEPFIDALKINIDQIDQQPPHELVNVIYIVDQLRLSYSQDHDQHELMTGVFYQMFKYYPKNPLFWSSLIEALISSIKVTEIFEEDPDEKAARTKKIEQDKQTKTQQWELLKLEHNLLGEATGNKKNPRDRLLNEFHFQSQKVLTKKDAADERTTLQRIGNLMTKWLNNQVDDAFTQEYSKLAKELKLTRSKVKRGFGILLGTLGLLVCVGSIVTLALMFSTVFVGTAIVGGLFALAGVVLYKVGKPDGALAVLSHFNAARRVKTPEPINVRDSQGYVPL